MPAPAVFARLQGRFRQQILIKGDLSRREKAWVADCARALRDAGLPVVEVAEVTQVTQVNADLVSAAGEDARQLE